MKKSLPTLKKFTAQRIWLIAIISHGIIAIELLSFRCLCDLGSYGSKVHSTIGLVFLARSILGFIFSGMENNSYFLFKESKRKLIAFFYLVFPFLLLILHKSYHDFLHDPHAVRYLNYLGF